MNKKSILIQARLSSSRFPRKMLEKIGNITLLEYVYNRCKLSKESNDVIVITSDEQTDDELYKLCGEKNIPVFRGSLDNVLKRYIDASHKYDLDVVCRVCGDSPFVDVEAIDKMFSEFKNDDSLEYMSTANSLNGFMSEVVTLELLEKIYTKNLTNEDMEHVTKFICDNLNKFNTKKLDLNLRPKELESFALTVDYPKDILIAQSISKKLNNIAFTSNDVVDILKKLER